MLLTLQEVMDTCSDWQAFCNMKGFSEFAVNEGGVDIQVELTIQEARKLSIVTRQETSSLGLDDGDIQSNKPLEPILEMLGSDEIGDLLSPDPQDLSDTRPIYDMRRVVDEKATLYIGLDSLSNKIIASAIGSILLADLTSPKP